MVSSGCKNAVSLRRRYQLPAGADRWLQARHRRRDDYAIQQTTGSNHDWGDYLSVFESGQHQGVLPQRFVRNIKIQSLRSPNARQWSQHTDSDPNLTLVLLYKFKNSSDNTPQLAIAHHECAWICFMQYCSAIALLIVAGSSSSLTLPHCCEGSSSETNKHATTSEGRSDWEHWAEW